MRAKTHDLLAQTGAGHVYTSEQLGPNRRLLPNGNLLCLNVPLARTGTLVYGPGEVPVQPGPNGMAFVTRDAVALFSPETIASFVGAAITDGHPSEDVTPDNFQQHACGYVLAARRGTGQDADVMLGDLVVTKRSTIDAILAGKVEVSAGYDADYRDNGGGLGNQTAILGNHVALVERGRCGPRCAIGDSEFQSPNSTTGVHMTTRSKAGGASRRATLDEGALAVLRQRAQDAVADLSAAETQDEATEDEGIHVHIHGDGAPQPQHARTGDAATLDRIAVLEEGLTVMQDVMASGFAQLTELIQGRTTDDAAPAGKDDKDGDADEDGDGANIGDDPGKKKSQAKTGDEATDGDSKALHKSYTQMMAHAEILVPGFKVPTFDAAAKRATTVDRMCSTRKLALGQYGSTKDGATMLKALGAEDIVSMDCATAATLFAQAAGARAAMNNAASTAGAHRTGDAIGDGVKRQPTMAEINEINRKFWEGK